MLLQLFQHEVLLQCKVVLVAAASLARAEQTGSVDAVWISLQSLLVAAANISKLLWGSRGKAEAERTDLRKSIAISESSPLRDPDLRNDFEHFDQRLETWFGESGNHVYVGRNIGQSGAIGVGAPSERFGHYDPQTGEAVFWTHSVSVPAIVNEAATILVRLQSELA